MDKRQTRSKTSDAEHGKRRAVQSPSARKTGSGPRAAKSRKTDPPESVPAATQGQSRENRTRSNETSRNPDMVKKLVAAWIGGAQGEHPFTAHESLRETIALRNSSQQCSEASSMVEMYQQKLKAAGSVIGNLKVALKAEEKDKMEMVEKINETNQITMTISDHINYITDTLTRCREHERHLSGLYDNVIVKQKSECTVLKDREKQLQDETINSQTMAATIEKRWEIARRADKEKFIQLQRVHEAELAKVQRDYENGKNALEILAEENSKAADQLRIAEQSAIQLQTKIHEYEIEKDKLTDQLTRVSENVQFLSHGNDKCELQIAEKDRNLHRMANELQLAATKITALSAEISALSGVKKELEEKLKSELNERQILSQNLNDRIDHLTQEVKRLIESKEEAVKQIQRSKDEAVEKIERQKAESLGKAQLDKQVAVDEVQKKLESAEQEIQRVLLESDRSNDELKERYELLLKIEVEKFERVSSDLRTMEARHKYEMSRTNTTSNTTIANANAERHKMQYELDSLQREKERLQNKCQKTEKLLQQMTTSERALQKKLDQAEIQASQLVSAAVEASSEKKRLDDENQIKVGKIKELEEELLNLKFNSAATKPIETPSTEPGRVPEKLNARKPRITTSTVLRKPIQYKGTARKTRSSPSTEKKTVTFDFDEFSSSEPSPETVHNKAAVEKVVNSQSLFDKVVGKAAMSASQPMRPSPTYSQTSLTQVPTRGRKFFRSRSSQLK